MKHERAHSASLLGTRSAATRIPKEPEHDFKAARPRTPTPSPRAPGGSRTSRSAAYNGQAANVTPNAFAAAARIVSVEARHAAWVRTIAGRPIPRRGSDGRAEDGSRGPGRPARGWG